MVQLIGILATDMIIKLLKHFLYALKLRTVGYIIKIMESEGYDDLRYEVVAKIVSCRSLFKQETDHVLAREIARKKIGTPSYCFASRKQHCSICEVALVK